MNLPAFLSVLGLAASLTLPVSEGAEAGPLPKIYDTKANGQEQIEKALTQAKKEKKNVLLKFGANYCSWCHLMSRNFKDHAPIAKVLKKNYILVLIDVEDGHNEDLKKKYGEPTESGLPALVVLDRTGKQLHTQDTSKFEDGEKYDLAKVLAFLKKWKP